MDRKSCHLLITGRVQGVWFRAWLQREAQAAGLDGWVRNRDDGRVEALIAGAPGPIDAFLAAAEAAGPDWGPPAARVDELAISTSDERPAPGFEIRRAG